MIDYDELDDRIRRIIREELRSAGLVKPVVIDSLVDGNAGNTYVDALGHEWEYSWKLNWYRLEDGYTIHESATVAFGPFKKVDDND